MKVTFKDIVWIGIIALVVIILSKCHRDETDGINIQYKDIVLKHKEDSVLQMAVINNFQGLLKEQEAITTQVIRQAEISGAQLNVSQTTVLRLASALKSARVMAVDTSFVTVSPEYVGYCDSLAVESEHLTKEVTTHRSVTEAVIASKDGEIAIRDSIIAKEHAFARECRSQFADLQTIYERSLRINKPRNQFYVGAEIIGNQTTVLQHVGAALSLKTKTNKLWQISAGLQSNGQAYARLNGNILITFK